MERPVARLRRIMKEYGISQHRLSQELGFRSPSSLSRIISMDPDQFDSSILYRIAARFPELNERWLSDGEGEMLKKGRTFAPVQSNRGSHHNVMNNIQAFGSQKIISPDGQVSIEPVQPRGVAEILAEIDMLRRENAELKQENAELKGANLSLEKTTEKLFKLLGNK